MNHLVLVPGFAGFDALGQLAYYAGVTPHFSAWAGGAGLGERVALRYFDNFPTAAVATRATRLRGSLAKRIARGQIAKGDRVVLVGHSTAGLDIRWLLLDLATRPDQEIPVDCGSRTPLIVKGREILDRVRRVVFLSVPHQGTNLADWVKAHHLERRVVVADLRATVWASQAPPVEMLEDWITGNAAGLLGADLLLAVQDSLREADPGLRDDAAGVADAQEAASQLALYLRHIASDFRAIDDLSCECRSGADLSAGSGSKDESSCDSPAHFDWATRDREREWWRDLGIEAKSYATLGRRPFCFDVSRVAPRWDLLKPWTCPDATRRDSTCPPTDVAYRSCYRACAGGPFGEALTAPLPLPAPLNDRAARCLAAWGVGDIAVWDNDGIVNTASMLSPPAGPVVVVPADHMDIVGHYDLEKSYAPDGQPPPGRKHRAYDLLGSQSEFDSRMFADVWEDIFSFAALP